MKNYVKTILFYLLLIGVVILLVAAIFRNTKQEKLVFSDMVGYFKEDRVVSFVIDEKFNVNLKVIKTTGDGALQADADGKWVTEEVSYKLRSLQLFEDYCGEYVANNANLQSYEIEPETTYPWWVSLLPYLFILLLGVGLVVFFVLRSPDGRGSRLNSFGKARTKTAADGKDKVTFADVAGADEEKQELEEIVDDEIRCVERLLTLVRGDSRLGFEASNHYFYTPLSLVEKIVSCEELKRTLRRNKGGNFAKGT